MNKIDKTRDTELQPMGSDAPAKVAPKKFLGRVVTWLSAKFSELELKISGVRKKATGELTGSGSARTGTPAVTMSAATKKLFEACKTGKLKEVEAAISDGAVIDQVDKYGSTPLHNAASRGSVEIVRLLLEKGAEVNKANQFGRTPLSYAAQSNHGDVVELLLNQKGIDVNFASTGGYTPLYFAAEEGHDKVVELLLRHKDIGVNIADKEGFTPLHHAADMGHDKVVELLLKYPNIMVNQQSKYGWSAIECAATEGRSEVVKKLIDKGGKVDRLKTFSIKLITTSEQQANIAKVLPEIEHQLLLKACQEGNVAEVKAAIKAGADVNQKDATGDTLLCIALRHNRLDIVGTLIAEGADVNMAGSKGQTPLHIAAQGSEPAMITELLTHGANPYKKDETQQTPFDIAEKGKNPEVMKVVNAYHFQLAPKDFLEKMRIASWNVTEDNKLPRKVTEKDVEMLRSGAEAGDSRAQYALGVVYEGGLGGVKKDQKQAFFWYRKAADKYNLYAHYALIQYYAYGVGTEADPKKAKQEEESLKERGFDLSRGIVPPL